MLGPAGGRVLIGLVAEALERGEVRLEGERLMRGGVEARPELPFEVDHGRVSAAPADGGVRLGVSGTSNEPKAERSEDEDNMSEKTFAPLPAARLVPSDKAAADRARMSQQAALRLAAERRWAAARMKWPRGGAPLPEPVLVRNMEPRR